jgi:glycosyltransferase involved in cell wall biosynthesis
MRIGIDAHYVGVRPGGNEYHFENLIRALAGLAGEERYVAFSFAGKAAGRFPADKVEIAPLRRGSVFLQRGLEIPALARKLGLDAIHVPFNFLPGGRYRKFVTIHDLAFLHVSETFGFLERQRMQWLTSFSARRADHVFTVSDYSKRDIIARYRIPENRITVTYNAVDRAVFRPWEPAAKAAFRARAKAPDRFLLFVGTLQPRKNVLGLLQAFKQLRHAQGCKLLLVGRKGWIYQDIFRFIRENDMQDKVIHREEVPLEDLVGYYNTAEGLVFPSFFEGFGMPILEAMACGCPVASAEVTSMPEIYGDAALPFRPDDARAMADRMEALLTQPRLRDDLIAKGFANCARFSWESSAAAARKVYLSA